MSHALGPPKMDRSWWRLLTNVVHWRREWQTTCLENPINSMKRQKDRTLKDELPRLMPNMLLEISGEITPERMKRESQSKNILWPSDAKSWLTWKDPDAGKDWRWEEKGMTEDEMVGWHHRLNGHRCGYMWLFVLGSKNLYICVIKIFFSWVLSYICIVLFNLLRTFVFIILFDLINSHTQTIKLVG